MPARFYCPDPPRDGRLQLNPDESRHLTRVCRLGPGDRVEIFDGRGLVASAMVVGASSGSVELQIDGESRAEAPPPFSLTLASAVPKGDRFDWLVEKATELGVERIIPLVTERSVVDPRVETRPAQAIDHRGIEAMPAGPPDGAGGAVGVVEAG